jgi:hypothetical protein
MNTTRPIARPSESLLTAVSAAVSSVENSETAAENIVAVSGDEVGDFIPEQVFLKIRLPKVNSPTIQTRGVPRTTCI